VGEIKMSDPLRQRAIIYVPASERDRWEAACLEYCAARGYLVVGLVEDDGSGERWAAVTQALMAGTADVAIVARDWHPPARRVPRVEVAEPEVAPDTRGPALPRQRRPRVVRR
jgi:hypothetical protein